MFETTILPFIKALPAWLFHTVEILIVAVIFSFATIFLWGMYVGIRIIGKRSNKIAEITIFPPTIKFDNDNSGKTS